MVGPSSTVVEGAIVVPASAMDVVDAVDASELTDRVVDMVDVVLALTLTGFFFLTSRFLTFILAPPCRFEV